MKKWILKPGSNVDFLIETLGDIVLYSVEDGDRVEVFVTDDEASHPFVEAYEAFVLPEIDWEADWKAHTELKEGVLEIPVGDDSIKMRPGPGFGNLTHSTTRLMLEGMEGLCKNKTVFDIGTGSGILALAAKKLGAKKVWAVDIDEGAVQHAKDNAMLNGLEVIFEAPEEEADLVLLNMIFSEQKEALKAYPFKGGKLLTSGLLKEEEKEYLKFAKEMGWKHLLIVEKEGWLSFLFE